MAEIMEQSWLGQGLSNFNYIKQNCNSGVLCTALKPKILLSVDPFEALDCDCAQVGTHRRSVGPVTCARQLKLITDIEWPAEF